MVQALVQSKPSGRVTQSQHTQTSKTNKHTGKAIKKHTNKGHALNIRDFKNLNGKIMYLVQRNGSMQDEWETEDMVDNSHVLVCYQRKVQEESGYTIDGSVETTTTKRPSRLSKVRAVMAIKDIASVDDNEEKEEAGNNRGIKRKSAKANSDEFVNKRSGKGERKTKAQIQLEQQLEERIQTRLAREELDGDAIVHSLDHVEGKDCCLMCASNTYREKLEKQDLNGFKAAFQDYENIPNFSEEDARNGLSLIGYAIVLGKHDFAEYAVKELKNSKIIHKKLNVPQKYKMYDDNTGRNTGGGYYNNRNFREVQESRGNRLGNSAFYRENNGSYPRKSFMNVDDKTSGCCLRPYMTVITKNAFKNEDVINSLLAFERCGSYEFYFAVNSGNRFLASKILAHVSEKQGRTTFNRLHDEVLKFDAEKPLSNYKRPQILKLASDANNVTPYHCAAIHPDSTYLAEFYDKLDAAERLETDSYGRSVAFYAAVSETSACLEFLISKGFNMTLHDKYKMTPLMQAARFGRSHNVKRLAKYLNGDNEDNHVSPTIFQSLVRNKRTALHYAAYFGHAETCRVLIELGAPVESLESLDKQTPLHFAAKNGYLDCVKVLIEEGDANPEKGDKFSRNALHLACIYGHLDIAYYLLSQGVDANASDSSQNSPAHYSAAYGYLKILHLLIQYGGANPSISNVWRSTPCSVANMKGHLAIVKYLLELPGNPIDVNFKDQDGCIMLQRTINESVTSILEMKMNTNKVKLLLSMNANTNSADITGCTSLHTLANNTTYIALYPKGWKSFYPTKHQNYHYAARLNKGTEMDDRDGVNYQVELARLLIENGANLHEKNLKKQTPLSCAMSSKNHFLVAVLIEAGSSFWIDTDGDGKNFFHYFGDLLAQANSFQPHNETDTTRQRSFLEATKKVWTAVESKLTPKTDFSLTINACDKNGYPPLQYGLKRAIEEQKYSLINEKQLILCAAAKGTNCEDKLDENNQRWVLPEAYINLTEPLVIDLTMNFLVYLQYIEKLVAIFEPDLNAVIELPRDFKKNNPKAKKSNYPKATGETVLHLACQLQDLSLIQFFLKHGADPNQKVNVEGTLGDTPLLIAYHHKKDEEQGIPEVTEFINNNFIIKKPDFKASLHQVIKTLLEHGCSPFDTNSIGNSTLLKASAKLDLKNLKLMCQSEPSGSEDIDTENEKNQTALMVAVVTLEKLIRRNKAFDTSVVELLLQSNANPNISFENGDTVLIKAISMCCFPLVKTILEKAIVAFDHNHQNKNLETALSLALRLNKQDIMSMYLQYLKNDTKSDKLNPNTFNALWHTPIFHACQHGNLDAVKTLIALGASPNIYKPASVPLIEAVKSCNLELIEFLLNNGADVNVYDHEGNYPLHSAVLTDKYRTVDLLLKYSADCSCTNARKQTPLHLAVEVTKKQTNRSFKIERSLIKMGANINAIDFFGRTPLHYVFVSCELIPITRNTTIIQKKVKQIIKEIGEEVKKENDLKNYVRKFDLGDHSNNSINPLNAVNAWIKEAKKMQLEQEYQLENASNQFTNNLTIDENEKERLKLYQAYKFEGNTITPERFDPIDILKFISSHKEIQFDMKDEFGRTPLHYAACVGAFSCTSILIERQVDIDALDIDNNGALQLALRNNHIDYSVMLCNSGASARRDIVLQNGNSTSTFGFSLSKSLINIAYIIMERSALLIESIRDALRNGKFHLVEILLQSADDHALCQVLEKEGQNIWHIIADFKPFNNEIWQDYLQEIILKISSLDLMVYSDKFGRSPLHYAAKHGQDVLLKHLINIQGVSCHNQDKEGKTELDYAVQSCNIQCVKILLEQGARTSRATETKHKSVLLRSVEERQFDIAELLLQNGAPKDDDDSANGWPNAVMVACQQKNIKMLKLLIQHGADLDTPSQIERKDKNQKTFKVLIHPIFIASSAGDLFLETLLQGGANSNVYGPNHEPENGQSCFMFNVSLNSVKNQKILLDYNIDLNMLDYQTSRTIFYWFFFQKSGIPKKKYPQLENSHIDISVYNKMLYSYQPQVNHIDTVTGMTPLEFAIYQNSLIVVERLLALGADVNLESCSNFIENVMNPHKTKLPAVLHAILINKLEMISLICEKTPQSINYLWQDNEGNNMLSYVLGIVNGYSHSNIETLNYIANQMTSANVKKLLRMKDVHGVPLVLYAYHRSNKELYKTLLSLDPTLQYFVSENYRSSDFDFENRPSLMSVDYIPTTKVDEDAQIERAKLQHAKDIESAKSGNKRQEKDELLKVDSYSKLERVGEIALDENDIPYNIVLMKVELNSWGTYTDTSFYKLSIIYNKVLDVYILWTRWGPFGKEGQHQKTPYLTKEEAVQEFKAIFKSKTGNVWDDHRTSFTIKPGRYEIMQKAQHPKDTIIEDFDFLKSDKPTQLSAEVLNLMKIICNYDYLSRVYTSTQIDMPLGQIPQKCIEEARGILREVKALINTYRGLNNCYSDKAKLLESKIYAFKIAQKCVAYSRLLPRNGDAYQGIRSLYGNGENLKKELSNLEDLSYVSFAANVLLAAKHHCSEINPLEYAFRTLNCTLRPLSLDTELQEYDMITHYMKSTCKEEYNLVHLFAVNRADEEIRFRPFENELDRKLLWHGSRIGNFMGILKQGLRASPRTSSSNGALLGNGIYFADTFEKSLGYSNDTYGQSSSPFRIMLLCEVALGSNQGKMKQTPSEEYEMHDSVKGEGANIPDPSNALYDSNGVCIPFGPCISNTNIQVTGNHGFNNVSLNYNEYAVYNEDRVKIRYLLILREKNNCHLCAKPEPSKSLRPFFHHELSKYKYTDFNIYETEVVKAYLQHQGKTPQDIFSQDLNEFIEKKLYNTKWDTPLDLQQDSKICTKCAMIITTMMLEKRMVDNRDRLDVLDTLNQKPRCRYGKECKNQQSIHHTKKYKHWFFDKLTDDIHGAQEELIDADNEHIMELDE